MTTSPLNGKLLCDIIDDSTSGERAFWLAQRQALLMWLDAIERRLNIQPRTADLRKEIKASGR
jgi:hypothetical protein